MIRRVACVGGGVVGAGWAARLALNGFDVTVVDRDSRCEESVRETQRAAQRVWRRLTPMSSSLPEGTVRFTSDWAEGLAEADFVQESLPEREEVKQAALVEMEKVVSPKTLIMSSTSGLLPSRLQSVMAHPERFCVAHPFVPVYLLPLVEICGGERTAAETRERAAAFYRRLGMSPLILNAEVDGFVADRLMEALWREALWLVHDGVATVAEVDDAIRLGCGLRWAFMGPFLTYRLGGGSGGMRHFMAQFAPTLKLPWTKLMEVPEMDDGLLDKIVGQSDLQVAGRSVGELVAQRDECLSLILRGLCTANVGAGAVLRDYEKSLSERAESGVVADGETQPPIFHRAAVLPDWIDYNGHMTESRYLQVFSDSTDAFLNLVDAGGAAVGEGRGGYYTVETHLRHLKEARLMESLAVRTQVLAADRKRLHLFHTLCRGTEVVATAEHLLLHVRGGAAAECSDEVWSRLRSFVEKHADLPPPEGVGRRVGMARRAPVDGS